MVYQKWMAFCGVHNTEEIESLLANKFDRLRMIVATCALERNENCWKEVAADWDCDLSAFEQNPSPEELKNMIRAAAYVPKFLCLLANKKTNQKKKKNTVRTSSPTTSTSEQTKEGGSQMRWLPMKITGRGTSRAASVVHRNSRNTRKQQQQQKTKDSLPPEHGIKSAISSFTRLHYLRLLHQHR